DAFGFGDRRLVLRRDGRRERLWRQRRQDREANARADALHRRQQAEPSALGFVREAVEMDMILAHMRLDEQPDWLAARRRLAQGSARREDEIADAVHIDD